MRRAGCKPGQTPGGRPAARGDQPPGVVSRRPAAGHPQGVALLYTISQCPYDALRSFIMKFDKRKRESSGTCHAERAADREGPSLVRTLTVSLPGRRRAQHDRVASRLAMGLVNGFAKSIFTQHDMSFLVSFLKLH